MVGPGDADQLDGCLGRLRRRAPALGDRERLRGRPRLQYAVALGPLLHERDAQQPRPRRHRDAQREGTVAVQRVLLPRAVAQHRARIGLRGRRAPRAAHGELRHAPAVDADLDLLPRLQPANVAVELPPQPDPDVVLRIHGEVMPDRDAPARPERQILAHAVILEPQLGDDVRLARRHAGRIAEGEAGDLPRRGQVALEPRRRHRQDVRHVVEAQVRIVGGQQRAAVDLQVQEVAYRVGVLDAVEAMRGRAAGIRVVGGDAVEGGLEHRGHGFVRGPVGTRSAGRGHCPGPQLAHDLLPRLGVFADLLDAQCVQRESGRPEAPVVAGHAVAIQDRPDLGRSGSGGGGRRLRVHGGGRRDEPRRAGCQGPEHRRSLGERRHHSTTPPAA